MCVQKIKAEKDFYKSLYRQVRHQTVNDTKDNISANLPPKPTFRKLENPYKSINTSMSSDRRGKAHASEPTSMVELTFDGNQIDMFDLLADKS